MGDQVEQIVLQADEQPVLKSVGRANAALDTFTAKGENSGKGFEKAGNLVIRTSDRTRTSVERLVSSAEKLSQTYGKTGVERLVAQRDQLIGRLGNEEKAVQRVRAAYDKMIAVESGSNGLGAKLRDAIQNPLQAAGNAAESLVSKMGTMGIAAGALAVGLGTLAKAGWDWAKSIGAMSDQIGDTAVRMGLTIQQEEAFRFAMNRAGGDMGTLENIMRKLSTEIEAGGENLSKMGLRFRDVQTGDLRPMSETILELSDRLRALPEGPIRNAAAIKVMGRAALEVLPDLMELGEGVRRFSEMKVGWTALDVKNGDEFRKKVAEIEAQWNTAMLALKKPIAASVILTIEGWEKFKTVMDFWPNIAKIAMGKGPTPAEVEKYETGGLGYGATGSRSAHRAEVASIAKNDAAIRARLQSTPEEALAAAKSRLAELAKDIPKGVTYDANATKFREYDEQKRIVAALEERIAITKTLIGATEALLKLQLGTGTRAAESNRYFANLEGAQGAMAIAGRSAKGLTEADFNLTRGLAQLYEPQKRFDAELDAQNKLLEAQIDGDKERLKASDDYWDAINDKIRAEQQRRFEDLKSSFEGLFDAAFSGARSFWDAMKRMAFSMFLTPIKESLANMMAGLLTGRGGGFSMGGGMLGGLGMAAAGAGGSYGGGGMGAVSRIVGGPGGTSGFAGPVGGQGGAAGASGGGPGGLLGGLSALKSFGWNAGSISLGAGKATTAAGIGGIGGGLAGFATSPAGLMAGGLLGYSGLKMGGYGGLGMTAGGGALAGAALGTMAFPGVGSAVGAGIGFLAGLGAGIVRLFIKDAAQKVIDKVRTLYGLKIDRKMGQQIADLGKQRYGGNLDMAVRSPESRELLKLWAQSQGQKVPAALMADTARPGSLVQSRGELFQAPQFDNGTAYAYPSMLRTFGGVQAGNLPTGSPYAGGSGNVTLILNGQSAAAVLEGRAGAFIQGNSRLVAQSAYNGSAASSTRGDSAALMIAPSVIQQ